MLMGKLQQERLVCAIWAVAAAERILEWATAYCRDTRISGKPIAKSQAVQFALVEMATEVKLGRNFIDKLIMDHMEGQNVVIETSMAKYWSTEMAKRIADRALDFCGNFGSLEKCLLARAWRDVRVMSIFAGTNEIMKSIAAKFMNL
jgi:acyl-CoA dehydrogenase